MAGPETLRRRMSRRLMTASSANSSHLTGTKVGIAGHQSRHPQRSCYSARLARSYEIARGGSGAVATLTRWVLWPRYVRSAPLPDGFLGYWLVSYGERVYGPGW